MHIGLLPIHFDKMDFRPKFFCPNLHKWFYLPYAFSVLYLNATHQKDVQTFPINEVYVGSDAQADFGFFNDKFLFQARPY